MHYSADNEDLRICREALAGNMGIFEAAKALIENGSTEDRWRMELAGVDALINMVDEVELVVPLGSARQHWNPQALAKKDKLKDEYEEQCRERAFLAFQSIIDEYERAKDVKPNS